MKSGFCNASSYFWSFSLFSRGCKIKEDETEAKTTKDNCKNAFSDCKKASVKGFKVLSACHRSVSQMVKMSAQLSSNVQKMGEVETSVARTDARNTKDDCSEVLSTMSRISEMAHENPSSIMISELCSSILESNINCNGGAKDAFQNSTKAFTTAILMVNKTLNVICANLMSKY